MTDELRAKFEAWYIENAFNYESNPLGSRECGLQWKAWQAAHASRDAEVEALRDKVEVLNGELDATQTTWNDAKRLNWMIFHGARVCWGNDGEVCNVEWFDEDEEELTRTVNYSNAREAIDAAMAKDKP